MKTDRDMTENILTRVADIRTARENRNRTIRKVAGVSCAFALIFALTVGFFGSGTSKLSEGSNPVTQSNANKGFFLMVANAADESETSYSKEKNVILPLGGILQIKNTNGMSAEDINRMSYELKLRLENLYGIDKGFHIRSAESAVAVHFGTADKLRLKIADPSAVDCVTLSCTDKGKLTVFDEAAMGGKPSEFIKTVKEGTAMVVTADEYMNYAKGEGMHIRWFLSDSYIAELDENTMLSEISDTISGKVTYIDGTEEDFTISLTFDDEGKLTAMYN